MRLWKRIAVDDKKQLDVVDRSAFMDQVEIKHIQWLLVARQCFPEGGFRLAHEKFQDFRLKIIQHQGVRGQAVDFCHHLF